MKESVSIIGAGSWGTTLAVLLARQNGVKVTLWTPFSAEAASIKKHNENKAFLPGVKLPSALIVTGDDALALKSSIIFIAVPVQYMRDVLTRLAARGVSFEGKIVVSVSKGIELTTLKTPYDIITATLPVKKTAVAVLSGPTIAKEVARGVPTVAVVAAPEHAHTERVQKLFKNSNLRVYRNTDVSGVELAGALKNVIAIACGISDGLGFGTNTKSALVCRGLVEMTRFARHIGAKVETLQGLAGLGDLATTAFSPDSRNRTVGEKIGKGLKLKAILKSMNMVAEGVVTSKSVYKLSKRYRIDMPITAEVYAVLYNGKSPVRAVKALMSRPLKAE